MLARPRRPPRSTAPRPTDQHDRPSGRRRCSAASPRRPTAGDALLVGLSNAVPSCAVVAADGLPGRRRRRRPATARRCVWEAWTGDGWVGCEVDRGRHRRLNKPGDVVLHVPGHHQASHHRPAARRLAALPGGRGPRRTSRPTPRRPAIITVEAFTIGGTAPTPSTPRRDPQRDRRRVRRRRPASGSPLQRRPVVPCEAPRSLHGASTRRAPRQVWTEVEHFAESGPDDRHFRARRDRRRGAVRPGGAAAPTAACASYGAVPPKGAAIAASRRTAPAAAGAATWPAGRSGCSRRRVPYVVPGREPAAGRRRRRRRRRSRTPSCAGPLLLRTRERAVTAEDYEQLARDVAPGAARVHCVPAPDAAGGRAGAGRAARGRRRRRPDRPRRTSIRRRRDARADQRQPRRAPPGRHPAAGRSRPTTSG